MPLSLLSVYSASISFIAFVIPLGAGAVAFAVFERGLLFELAVGVPDFPDAVFVAADVMLFGEWLFAGRVVGDPLAVADAVLEAALGGERAVLAVNFPTAVGFAVDVGGFAIYRAVFEVVGPLADLASVFELAFDERFAAGVVFAVLAIGSEVVVGVMGDLAVRRGWFCRRRIFRADFRG